MIEANELRLVVNGLYYWQGIPIKMDLNTIGKFERGFKRYGDLQPVLLTEEILLKCGFSLLKKFSAGKQYGFVAGGVFNNALTFIMWDKQNELSCNLRHIKYLHQLQNAIYVLTNKELEVNL